MTKRNDGFDEVRVHFQGFDKFCAVVILILVIAIAWNSWG